MKLIFFITSVLLTIAAGAQRALPEFGKPDLAELKLTSCSFEPTANAMVLFDWQEIEIDVAPGASRIRTDRRVRIKIFNEKGFKHASIKIPFYNKKRVAKIKGISAVVHNLDANGKVVTQKLDEDDFFKEKVKNNLGIATFTFPNLKSGSVIEFRYVRIENNILQLEPWYIQGEIPVAYSTVTMISPVDITLKDYVFGADTIPRTSEFIKSDRFLRTNYFTENINSFQEEPFMSSTKDHLKRILFSLIPRSGYLIDVLTKPEVMWNIGGDLFKEIYNTHTKPDIPGTEKLLDTAKNYSSSREKIEYLYYALRDRIPQKAEQSIIPEDIKEAWNNRTANSAEINLILINLLKKAGVECYPLLVSTRENGRINRGFPSASQFNGVDVLAVDSLNYFILDATLPYQSYLNPPLNILNRQAFLLSDSVQWVFVSDDRFLLKKNTNVFALINLDGKMEGAATTAYYDYAKSYRLDSTLSNDDDKDKEKNPIGLQIHSSKQENAKKEGEPLNERIEFTYEPGQTGDFYFINPRFLVSDEKNPFIQVKRNTDIDLGCKQQFNFSLNLKIPDDWEFENVPKNTLVRAPDSSFFFRRYTNTSGSNIFYNYTFEINRPAFDKEEYDGVKEFFGMIHNLMAEEIILRRKKK